MDIGSIEMELLGTLPDEPSFGEIESIVPVGNGALIVDTWQQWGHLWWCATLDASGISGTTLIQDDFTQWIGVTNINEVRGLCLDPAINRVYAAIDGGRTGYFDVNPASGEISNPNILTNTYSTVGGIRGFVRNPSGGTVYSLTTHGRIYTVDVSDGSGTLYATIPVRNWHGLAIDGPMFWLVGTDPLGSSALIRHLYRAPISDPTDLTSLGDLTVDGTPITSSHVTSLDRAVIS